MTLADAFDGKRGCPGNLEPACDPDLIDPSPFVKRMPDGLSRLELIVHGARCGGCISKIEGGLATLPGVNTARLNLSTGKLAVTWRGALSPVFITQKISALGYRAAPFDPDAANTEADREARSLLLCLAVAGFATANIMLLSVAVWAGHNGEMGAATRDLMHWLAAAIALPASAFAARPFFSSAWRALRAGKANMDVPISLAVVLALSMSVYETINHGRDAYFDAAVMLLFFLLIGRYLDHSLRARARAAARDLLALQAIAANRLRADGVVEAVSANDIAPGDYVVLAPGDRAPVNGVVTQGASEFDLSLVTGESAPVRKHVGDTLYAGVVNMSARLVMRATARVSDSLVADLTRLIEAGEQTKSRYVRLADRAAALYVPLVHTLALATFLGWLIIGDAGMRASVMTAVAVLIITCPCALGLAAPAVQVVATGRLFKAGVLVKSGDALERLAEVDTVVFDKTGTLTIGKLRLTNSEEIEKETIEQAAMLARTSRHPLARAVVSAAGAGPVADNAIEAPGLGVEGSVDGARARFGRGEWVGAPVTSTSDERAATEAWFQIGDQSPVKFEFADVLRTDAREIVASLRVRGLNVEMLSGDRSGPAAAMAAAASIDEWQAELTPAEKIARLDALSAGGAKVAMIGDGLNDAPALAAAHASLSPGSAADASQAAADFVFQGEGLAPVLTAFDVAKTARRRVLQNFLFAAVYNLCAIPLAVFGFVTPLIAALAMSGSSIVVTLNALRMRRNLEARR